MLGGTTVMVTLLEPLAGTVTELTWETVHVAGSPECDMVTVSAPLPVLLMTIVKVTVEPPTVLFDAVVVEVWMPKVCETLVVVVICSVSPKSGVAVMTICFPTGSAVAPEGTPTVNITDLMANAGTVICDWLSCAVHREGGVELVRLTVKVVVVRVFVMLILKVAELPGVTAWVSSPWMESEIDVTACASSERTTTANPRMARMTTAQIRAPLEN